MKKTIGLLILGLTLTSCTNNCAWVGTETTRYDDGFNIYEETYDVYECETILRERVLINNKETIEDLN